ncbi:hypothetical protein PAMA_020927 [Pampus argenteus]
MTHLEPARAWAQDGSMIDNTATDPGTNTTTSKNTAHETTAAGHSLQVCTCGWAKVTSVTGLKIHQGKKPCLGKQSQGSRIDQYFLRSNTSNQSSEAQRQDKNQSSQSISTPVTEEGSHAGSFFWQHVGHDVLVPDNTKEEVSRIIKGKVSYRVSQSEGHEVQGLRQARCLGQLVEGRYLPRIILEQLELIAPVQSEAAVLKRSSVSLQPRRTGKVSYRVSQSEGHEVQGLRQARCLGQLVEGRYLPRIILEQLELIAPVQSEAAVLKRSSGWFPHSVLNSPGGNTVRR